MALEEFKAITRTLATIFLKAISIMLEDKKIEPKLKRKLIATGLSLVLYIQEDFENLCNGSEDSISND
ncbi:MAG: hypothetical protein K2J79_03950 [Ruminiclostridium sp.]|nr:hypothetical protein [Ruminiclostridium sp.]